jgi:hypothetical protein
MEKKSQCHSSYMLAFKITLFLFLGMVSFVTVVGQTTVFVDDFNRGAVVSPLTNGGTPTMTWTTTTTSTGNSSGGGATSRTNLLSGSDYTLQILAANSSSSPAQSSGRTFVSGSLSTISYPFNPVLSNNSGDVSWTFVMRTNRSTALSGFASNNYAAAVVLASTSADFMTANGYAVIMVKGTTTNAVSLVKFTGGLGSTPVTIIGPSTDIAANSNFVSVKVVYLPSSNTWQLYVRDDASNSVKGDPVTVNTQVGSNIVDATYTNSTLTHFGFFWNHSAASAYTSNTVFFDDFRVSTIIPPPTTYTWNATGTASWATPSNWTPERTAPLPNDILRFNAGGSVIVTGVPSQTIGQLLISNNTDVEFQSAAGITLTIAGEDGTDLNVASGSSLNVIQPTNAITIALQTGATGAFGGAISYRSAAHKLTAADASGIIFQSGSLFTAGTGFSGNAFGTTNLNSVIFESGSTYIYVAGGNPFGASSGSNSVVVWQTGSLYKHTSSGTPSVGTRTYANFELDAPGATITSNSSQTLHIDNLIITNGKYVYDVRNTFTINNITVATGAAVEFSPTSAATVSVSGNVTIAAGGQFTNNLNSTLTATNLLINSDATGTGTFVNGGTASFTGTSTIRQHLGSQRNWYVSSPVAAASSPATNISRYYEFVEAGNNNPEGQPTGSSNFWKGLNAGHTMAVGKGYIAQVSAGTTAEFSGALNNNASYPIAVSRTASAGSRAGFNLVGNPYPAYLDWSLVIADEDNANIGTTFWYRTKNTSEAYTFSTHNGTSGITVTGTANTDITKFIPPMQAFWVRVNESTASTNLTVRRTMLAHRDVANNKFKAPQNIDQPVLRLQVTNAVNTDEAILYFNSNAKNDFDAYDSPKMFNSNAAVPEIYTRAGNERLVINGMNACDFNMMIPLGFVSGQAGNFSIRASQLQNFDSDTHIVLLDKTSNTQFNLTEGESYSFTSDATNTEDRFAVLFKSASGTSSVEETTARGMYVFSQQGRLTLQMNTAPENARVTVFTATGQSVYSQPLNTQITQLNHNFESGLYLIKIENAGKTVVIRNVVN